MLLQVPLPDQKPQLCFQEMPLKAQFHALLENSNSDCASAGHLRDSDLVDDPRKNAFQCGTSRTLYSLN